MMAVGNSSLVVSHVLYATFSARPDSLPLASILVLAIRL